jgi:hypothetical protein
VKVRRQLQRRVAASAACARRDAAWWREWFPAAWVQPMPLRGRAVVYSITRAGGEPEPLPPEDEAVLHWMLREGAL